MGRNAKQTGSRDDRSANAPDLIAIDRADRSISSRSPRYRVDLVIVAQGYTGPSYTFTSRTAAERFARAISFHLPARATERDLSPAWVLVYALPLPDAHPYQIYSPNGLCYLCYDANGVTVKRHEINGAHYGAKGVRHAA